MGTNYYLHRNACPTCHRSEDVLHIGKSSAGWCFSLHVDDDIKSLDDWKRLFDEGVIRDEYGHEIPTVEMLKTITERVGSGKYPNVVYASREAFNMENGAVDGPNGLARHALRSHCVGHGEGTWDLIPGEFS